MADPNPAAPDDGILSYSPKTAGPRRLHLSEVDGEVVVTFPTPPEWLWVIQFAVLIAMGLMQLGAAWTFAVLLYRMARTAGPAATPETLSSLRPLLFMLACMALSGAGWLATAGYSWWSRRRGAWEPRTLAATRESLVFAWFGWIRIRQTVWPVSSVAGIELHKIRGNLNWTRTVADLHVRLHKGRRKRFRLSSPDPLLPDLIAQRLSTTLGVPLSQRSWRRIVW